jgi:hypothetical protein
VCRLNRKGKCLKCGDFTLSISAENQTAEVTANTSEVQVTQNAIQHVLPTRGLEILPLIARALAFT